MPASTTYRFQMIDVVFVGKLFKGRVCDKWASWMLKMAGEDGLTDSGNYKYPTESDCVAQVSQFWEEIEMDGVKKAAFRLGMTSELGPEIPGYVRNDDIADLQPSGEEVDVSIAPEN